MGSVEVDATFFLRQVNGFVIGGARRREPSTDTEGQKSIRQTLRAALIGGLHIALMSAAVATSKKAWPINLSASSCSSRLREPTQSFETTTS